jgi:hypothetical protein
MARLPFVSRLSRSGYGRDRQGRRTPVRRRSALARAYHCERRSGGVSPTILGSPGAPCESRPIASEASIEQNVRSRNSKGLLEFPVRLGAALAAALFLYGVSIESYWALALPLGALVSVYPSIPVPGQGTDEG